MKSGHPSRRLHLTVQLGATVVGRLQRESSGRVRFDLDEDWLRSGQIPALGVSFFHRPEPRFAGTGLPTWFENLLPELDTPLRKRICQRYEVRERDSAGLLRLLGGDLPGAVIIGGDTDEVVADEDLTSAQQLRLRFSLAGVQLKFSVIAAKDRYVLPVSGQDGKFIAKIAGTEHPELPEVEAATMTWAHLIGFRVPSFRVIERDLLASLPLPDDCPNAFLVERFDRTSDNVRIHQEDLAQAMEFAPQDKYSDSGGAKRTSYDAIGCFVRDVCGELEAQEFVRRLAFVVASGNGDAHLKNWTLQWPDPGVHRPCLSPNYDLVATISWNDYGWRVQGGPRLALAFGRKRAFGELDRARLKTFAERCKIPDAVDIFVDTLQSSKATWSRVSDTCPPRMRKALEEHWTQVPLLRWVGPLTS